MSCTKEEEWSSEQVGLERGVTKASCVMTLMCSEECGQRRKADGGGGLVTLQTHGQGHPRSPPAAQASVDYFLGTTQEIEK